MRREITLNIAFAIIISASLLFLLGTTGGESQPEATEVYVLKAGHSGNTSEPYHLGMLEFARIARELSNGRLQVDIYPAMQLGGEKVMIEGLYLGTLDISVTANGSATNFVPTFGVLDLPFLFRDRAHMYNALDGWVGDRLGVAAQHRGLRVLAFYDAGIRHIMTSDRPVEKYEDLRGLKIRTMPVPAHLASFNAFGAQAVAIDYGELYGSLQTGLIDGAEAANTNYVQQKFYEVAPYWAQVGWTTLVADVLMSEEKFRALPEDLQDVLLEAGRRSAKVERDLYSASDNAFLGELRARGVQMTYPDSAPFRRAAESVYENFVKTEEEHNLFMAIQAE